MVRALLPRPRGRTTGPSRRRARLAAVLATVAVVPLASCTVGPSIRPELATSGGPTPTRTAASTEPAIEPERSVEPLSWHPCPSDIPSTADDGTTYDIECAELIVPVSHPQPRRGSLDLAVARAQRTDTRPDLPPVVVVPAPGTVHHTAIAQVAASLPTEVTDRSMVVMVDARGTGGSTGIDCVSESTAHAIVGMAADPTSSVGADQLAGIARQLTFDCGDAVGPALTKLNSTNAAVDLDILRAAMGLAHVTLVADGAGATIGAAYVDLFPRRVGAAVLGSPRDPLSGPAAHALAVASAAQASFDDFAESCAEFTGGCPLGSDPDRAVRNLVDRWSTSGIPAGDLVITGGSALLSLLTLLPERDRWPDLAHALAEMSDGDATSIADVLTESLGGDAITAALSAQVIYACNDETDRLQSSDIADLAAAARERSSLFGPFAASLAGLCGSWPAPDEPLGRLSGEGAAPVLVIGSTGAITNPFREVQSVAGQLASATLVTWQSAAPNAYPVNRCVTEVVDAYLLAGTVPARGVLCPP